ncbi:MAG: hypothetical protein D6679_08525 [Candidatus Hydrogenedentota bacterium]|nr:MAG: hypothetical protein D6679_08525 [Candidatus Hydrogenedentota bacterium]
MGQAQADRLGLPRNVPIPWDVLLEALGRARCPLTGELRDGPLPEQQKKIDYYKKLRAEGREDEIPTIIL